MAHLEVNLIRLIWPACLSKLFCQCFIKSVLSVILLIVTQPLQQVRSNCQLRLPPGKTSFYFVSCRIPHCCCFAPFVTKFLQFWAHVWCIVAPLDRATGWARNFEARWSLPSLFWALLAPSGASSSFLAFTHKAMDLVIVFSHLLAERWDGPGYRFVAFTHRAMDLVIVFSHLLAERLVWSSFSRIYQQNDGLGNPFLAFTRGAMDQVSVF